jgi:protein translocase SecG subunit
MGFVTGLLSVIAVLSALLLAFVVLIQEPKGGGIAAALGGSGMEAIGAATGSVNRFTSWMAGIWMTACFLLSLAAGGGPAIVPPSDPPADDAAPGGSQGGTQGGNQGGGGGQPQDGEKEPK